MPLVLFLLVIALHLWLAWGGGFPGDHWALRQGWTPHSLVIRDFGSFFQHLGTPLVAIVLATVAMVLILARGSMVEAAGLVVACFAVPLNALLKLVLGPSPLWRSVHPGSNDYPSGHVTFTVAVIGYIGLIAWRYERRWITALAVLLIIGVGPARVVIGVHLISDVVGGYLLGAAMLLLARSFTTESSWRTLDGIPPAWKFRTDDLVADARDHDLRRQRAVRQGGKYRRGGSSPPDRHVP